MAAFLAALLVSAAACGPGRQGAEKEGPANEKLVVNRVGDMRLRSGDISYSAGAPGGKQAESRDAGRTPPGGGVQAGGSSAGGAAGGTGGAGAPAGGAGDAVSAGQAAIEEKYVARLQSLASGYESEIMALYSRGMREIRSIPASNARARADVAATYYEAGLALEAECNGRFYEILAAFESELKANGYPTGKARQAEEAYENTKQDRAGQLIHGAGPITY